MFQGLHLSTQKVCLSLHVWHRYPPIINLSSVDWFAGMDIVTSGIIMLFCLLFAAAAVVVVAGVVVVVSAVKALLLALASPLVRASILLHL